MSALRGLLPLLLLAVSTSRAAATGPDCVTCHAQKGIAGSALRDFARSKHAAAGLDCATCHLTGDAAKRTSACEANGVLTAVSATLCANCHAKQAEQFGKGKHAAAWVAMEAMPTTKDQPQALIDGMKGCGGCHRIGWDGGRCDSCHTRHTFSAAEARRPEACATCHMGFDHPQWEMYSTSKHGTITAQTSHKVNWEMPLASWFAEGTKPDAATPRAPTCAFCHMPDGDHGVRTAWGFLALRLPEDDAAWMADRATILKGLGILDRDGNPTPRLDVVKAGDVARLTREAWQAERSRMTAQCTKCHAPATAKEELAKGDEIIKAADHLMAEAIRTVEALYKDGILRAPKDRPFTVDMLRFYEAESPIEQKLWVMLLEHRMRTFQGAFHMNPDYQHWYGWAEMKRDLLEIQEEARTLRWERALKPAAAPARTKPPAKPAARK